MALGNWLPTWAFNPGLAIFPGCWLRAITLCHRPRSVAPERLAAGVELSLTGPSLAAIEAVFPLAGVMVTVLGQRNGRAQRNSC
ncbi:MAG: hypothetical protein CM15mP120_08590 [Pseudomonadota bacterium]|nr:MAG: hypothetical protein CM15mP120_08590 [Pseudomonadota bacterium]